MELLELLNNFFETKIENLHFCLPACVEEYDYKKKKAKIKITLKKRINDKIKLDYPLISNVPVVFPCTKKGYLHFELNKGDSGICVFSEKSLEDWLSSNDVSKISEPVSLRKMNLSDGIFIPGLYSFNDVGKEVKVGKGFELNFKDFILHIDETHKTFYGNETANLYKLINLLIEIFELVVSNSNWIGNMGAPVQFLMLTQGLQKINEAKLQLQNLLKESYK